MMAIWAGLIAAACIFVLVASTLGVSRTRPKS